MEPIHYKQHFVQDLKKIDNFIDGHSNFSVFDDILTDMRKERDRWRRVGILRKQLEDKKKEKDQSSEEVERLKRKLQKQKDKYVRAGEDLEIMKKQKSKAYQELEEKEAKVKNQWKALMLAIGCYKDHLNFNVSLQESYVIIRFLGISDDEKLYLLKMTNEDGHWRCLKVNPEFKKSEELIEMLHKTNDMQGFLSSMRQIFKSFKRT